MSVPILILAGGTSTRMGNKHKLLEVVDGQPLLRLQAWRALKASPEVTVLLRPGQPALRRAVAGLPVRTITPQEALEGIGGSLRAGTRAHLGARAFMVLLADLVEIEAQDMRAVMQARSTGSGALIWQGATQDGRPGHPILFESALYGHLLTARQDVGAKALVEQFADRRQLVPLPGRRARVDLDTPQDWAAWRAQRDEISSEGN